MFYSNLQTFYEVEFALKFHHGYSIQEQADMLPFERDIHVARINAHLKDLKAARENPEENFNG